MRAALVVVVMVTGCQCAPTDVGDAGGDGSGGGGGSSVAGGVPTALQLQMPGSGIARTCEQGSVSSFGSGGVTAVRNDTEITLDAGRWLEFFDGIDCEGAATDRLTLHAGESTRTFRYRVNAWGELSTEATAETLERGVATLTSYAEISFVDEQAALPIAVCKAVPPLCARAPSSEIEVPAANTSVFTLRSQSPFGGKGLNGCTDPQFEVTMAEGSSCAEVFAATEARDAYFWRNNLGRQGQLTISSQLPPGATLRVAQLALFAQCLPVGSTCRDEGSGPCCGAHCVEGTCPACRADGEVFSSLQTAGPNSLRKRLPCCTGIEIVTGCDCEGKVATVCVPQPTDGGLGAGQRCASNENCASGICRQLPTSCPSVVCPQFACTAPLLNGGDTCANAPDVTDGGIFGGSTKVEAGANDDYAPAIGTCRSAGSASGGDVAYAITPTTTTVYTVSVTPAPIVGIVPLTPVLYAQLACGTDTCLAGTTASLGQTASITFSAPAGQTVYLIVDGEGSSSGEFAISIQPAASDAGP